MVEMPIQCSVCGTNKNPSLMYSSDTCCECAEKPRLCTHCGKSTVAKSWVDCVCPLCGESSESTGFVAVSERIKGTNPKPSIIEVLSTLGWVLFILMGMSGLYLMVQDGGEILGLTLIIAGVFEVSILLGFSAIVDQLYQINKNTSSSDEDD